MKPKEAKRLMTRYRKAFVQGNTSAIEALTPNVQQLLVEVFTDETNQSYHSVMHELYRLPTPETQKLLRVVYKATYQIAHDELEEANRESELEDYITKMFLNYKPD